MATMFREFCASFVIALLAGACAGSGVPVGQPTLTAVPATATPVEGVAAVTLAAEGGTLPAVPRVTASPMATMTPAEGGPGAAPATGAALPSTTATASPATSIPAQTVITATRAAVAAIPVYTYKVVQVYPHDRQAFTEGLVYRDGFLYEGTGLYGQSELRKVELESGRVVQSVSLAEQYFGEGISVYDTRIVQLTWKSHLGFVYDENSFGQTGRFSYPTEGWGLTFDGQSLIMSDGTSVLHYLDPQTYTETHSIRVTGENGPVDQLNELEFIDGEIYANVWQTDFIARIDPQTGQVVGWIDLTGLLGPEDRTQPVDVLNGIAYDAQGKRLFVTGKLSAEKLFQIELVQR